MPEDELLYRIALTMIPALGPVRVKALADHFGEAAPVFNTRKKDLVPIIGEFSAAQIKAWKDFDAAAQELAFTTQHTIRVIFLTDPQYPQRLLHCYDPPSLLYYRGQADLNHARIVSVIGTRNNTAYGRQVTEELIGELTRYNVIVVSGLAFGIDAIAHKAALQHGMATIGVLAHGLDSLYPSQNRSLAREMEINGGLLTEFRKGTQPDKHNFPKRNRIVAGMADTTIVVETATKGGSMITAALAHDYNRDLFAVPGKLSDPKSSGCLELIRQQKAQLFSSVTDLAEIMGWAEKKKIIQKQTALFIELSPEEKKIIAILQGKDMTPVDELYLKSGLSNSQMANAILNLELKNVICSLPGKMFSLV